MADQDKDEPENLKVMGIFEHIEELRERLITSVFVLVVMFAICYYFTPQILGFLKVPLTSAPGAPTLYFTGPMDGFMAKVKIGFFTALILSCPVWLYQVWKFLEPALYEKEKKYVLPFMISSISLFIAGIALCYYMILPLALKYLIELGTEMGAQSMITINEYLSLIMLMMAGFGAVFETPVVLTMLALLGVITAQDLRSNRKYVVIGIFIVAAVITPTPDPVSQFAMALPTWILYEGSIVIIAWLDRKKAKEEAKAKGK
ncbi:MAG: twin-arginine translocase subunit TatC [Chitinophagaceae bacterium]|nr:twin-arginine translocase subunit TatC [Oligoflexus sp.]